MAKLRFEDLYFTQAERRPEERTKEETKEKIEEKIKEKIKVIFLKNFYFLLDKKDLEKIGPVVIQGHEVIFEGISGKEARRKLGVLLAQGFNDLRTIFSEHKAIYIHQNSGIPLFGTLYFGIVDRGTNILEVKPITGCNIDCVFCSVGEGKHSNKLVDYVVEKDYLLQKFSELIDYKELKPEEKLDVYINTHGEPLLYGDMIGLVRGLKESEAVRMISIITNGLLLSKKLVDELAEAGLDQLNVSVNSMEPEKAKELAGSKTYDINKIKETLTYAAKKLDVVIAPVYIKGVNDDQMDDIIEFSKKIGASVGIQNYLAHKRGKKIAKELSWNRFFAELEVLEKRHGIKLKLEPHKIFATKQLEKPFVKGDVIKAELVCPGRIKGEKLGVAKGRVISILGCETNARMLKTEIIRDKDGIYVGKAK